MDQFFAYNYAGKPFIFFGFSHIAALMVLLLVNIWLIWRGKRLSQPARKAVRLSLAALLLVNEAAWHGWVFATGQWTIQTMLPLQLCSMFVFLSAIMLFTKNYQLYEFCYFLGIGGALQALITPDAGIYGFPHFRYFQVFISHGSIVTAAVYMTVVEGFRPTWMSIFRVSVYGNVYMLVVGIINIIIGSNYLFTIHKPYTPSLLDLLPAWPWYLYVVELIGLVSFFLLYLPFISQGKSQTGRQVNHIDQSGV